MKNRTVIGILISTVFLCIIASCSKQFRVEQEVFFSDFETNITEKSENLKLSSYQNNTVAGFYNSDTLTLELENLPTHELAIIEFDLYIHDTWDGNYQESDGVIRPDIWRFTVDGEVYINTTFANAYCPPGQHCPPQSYPSNYPSNAHLPRSGSIAKLPGVCVAANDPEATTLYRIKKTIRHSSKTMRLSFEDELVPNTACDESWSIDNLRVRVVGE